jgi:hypothetical protein
VRDPLSLSARRTALDSGLGPGGRTLPPQVPRLRVGSVNDDEVIDRVGASGPPLLSIGSSIVRSPLLRRTSLALNLHWGLAPYYRGLNCTEWALLGWDPLNIGVTVHAMTDAVDGGPIVGQARVAVEPDATLGSIRMQQTRIGAEIIVDAIGRVTAGEELRLVEQDLSQGRLTLRREWNFRLQGRVERMMRDGTLTRMLSSPARPELPIVTPASQTGE